MQINQKENPILSNPENFHKTHEFLNPNKSPAPPKIIFTACSEF